jgi:hypothetical protein
LDPKGKGERLKVKGNKDKGVRDQGPGVSPRARARSRESIEDSRWVAVPNFHVQYEDHPFALYPFSLFVPLPAPGFEEEDEDGQEKGGGQRKLCIPQKGGKKRKTYDHVFPANVHAEG